MVLMPSSDYNYHHTDLPIIVSGKKAAFLEPHERVWPGESGHWYDISECQRDYYDSIAPFNGISGFSHVTTTFPGTFFRFPLRTLPSELSKKLYTIDKLHGLLGALKKEAKFLLLFLHSVDTIEVYDIGMYGRHTLVFGLSIVEREDVYKKRLQFKQTLKSACEKQSFSISQHIPLVLDFHINITENTDSPLITHHWLVVSCVGSSNKMVLEAAVEQCAFPWVGVALELSDDQKSQGGRIFCFLPMPEEATCHLPVHVNGTFGVDKDRRALKLPSVERTDDPTAEWNVLLVKHMIPQCYTTLLKLATKIIKPEKFYKAWPNVSRVRSTVWKVILQPLFTLMFDDKSVWTERMVAYQAVSEFIKPSEGTFIPRDSKPQQVVLDILTLCGLKLVSIPPHMWDALSYINRNVNTLSPKTARAALRGSPSNYSGTDRTTKLELLRYCLQDCAYNDLLNLALLPLANGTFVTFDNPSQRWGWSVSTPCYVVSQNCPRDLLPNLNHLLVDLSDDSGLHQSLQQVAKYNYTQLKELNFAKVAQLLSQSMPREWQGKETVSLPHCQFPSIWFHKFWTLVSQSGELHHFCNMLVVPLRQSSQLSSEAFQVTKLTTSLPHVYVTEYDLVHCPTGLLTALERLGVMCSQHRHFHYLYSNQYMNKLNINGVLAALSLSKTNLHTASLTAQDANSLREFLSNQIRNYSSNAQTQNVLKTLPIFTTTDGTQCSVVQIKSISILRAAVVQPHNFEVINSQHLPPNFTLFSRSDYKQTVLLQLLSVSFPDLYTFVMNNLLPILGQACYDSYCDKVLQDILNNFSVITSMKTASCVRKLYTAIGGMAFLRTTTGALCKPQQLYDPTIALIKELYAGESKFPTDPFSQTKYLQHLRNCGLHTAIQPQEIIDVILAIAPASSGITVVKVDSTKLTRIRAVFKCLSSRSDAQWTYVVLHYRSVTFSSAIQSLLAQRSWLPVASTRPRGYSSSLTWKGENYDSHVTPLHHNSVLVYSSSLGESHKMLPYVAGSQMYLVDLNVEMPHPFAQVFFTEPRNLVQQVLAHLKCIVSSHQQMSGTEVNTVVHFIYKYFYNIWRQGHSSLLQELSLTEKWIWIQQKHTFVTSEAVAARKNPTFRQDLEPYLYILPEGLKQFEAFFIALGVQKEVTHSQIVSVLSSVKCTTPTNTVYVDSSKASELWQTVMSVLNWLTNNGTTQVNLSSQESLLVPIESDSPYPQLVKVARVVYTDIEFLRKFASQLHHGESYTLVHHRVNSQLAHCLRLTPLSEFLDISEDAFGDAGPCEPLTVRLKELLRDYKDGLTIIKELLQNADDAEATELNICYDARTHTRDSSQLFFEGMADCHGPALVVHNNRPFTKEDFTNITKLGDATKKDKPLKIGKFGLGFCSVYHITDIPSFISQNMLYVFDPTLNYLKKEIQDSAKPGKKVKTSSWVIAQSRQLDPYDGLFGYESGKSYSETIFRFPFRTHQSELSGTLYTDKTVNKLMQDMQSSGAKLLLFLRNITCITFQQIKQGEDSPKCILKIAKTETQVYRSSARLVKITSTCTHPTVSVTEENWLLMSANGSINGAYSTASVACSLESSASHHMLKGVDGEMFCFLPLSFKTGLPVHVSSNFAVMSNRAGIWSSDENAAHAHQEVQWNIQLMTTVVPNAYYDLLIALKSMHCQKMLHDYKFYSLWPLESELHIHNPWSVAVRSLYSKIQASDLLFSSAKGQWLTIANSKVLSQHILVRSFTKESIPKCVLKVVKHLNLPVVDLPVKYLNYLKCGHSIISEKTFVELFFRHITSLSSIKRSRNEALLNMFEVFDIEYQKDSGRAEVIESYLRSNACVPCSPDGIQLKWCAELVHPNAEFAELFDHYDGMFPSDMFVDSHLVLSALEYLGIVYDFIPWRMLVERAGTIKQLYNSDQTKGLKRVELILQCVDINRKEKNIRKQRESHELASIQFLPVVPKPANYPLEWKGSMPLTMGKNALTSGAGDKNLYLAGSQVCFVNERKREHGGCSNISAECQKLLQIKSTPTVDQVIQQFKQVITVFKLCKDVGEAKTKLIEWTNTCCQQIYHFLDSKIESLIGTGELQGLKALPCVWTGSCFLNPNVIAFESKVVNGPYLFQIPSSLSSNKKLAKALEIKDTFTSGDIIAALENMKRDFGNTVVDDNCKKFLRNIIPELHSIKASEELIVMLPDTKYVMHNSRKLAFNDAAWLPPEEGYVYVHSDIPRDLAEQLGVRLVRNKRLEKYASRAKTYFGKGYPFGQREELTQRIQNIIREYTMDETVLKELLQNADDAKATKMYVILDKRFHKTERVLSDEWHHLQGPALLVWNDKTFSEKDLEGIQKLGLGSKRPDSETIGQYGIGFNVVYHLTDCPSFISGGEKLCIMDPHCRFAPDADVENPGRMFDLNDEFWNDFPDLRSAYLQANITGCPSELLGGSLFRFPLRHTYDLVRQSEIIDQKYSNYSVDHYILDAERMHRFLRSWIPKIKQALLFLNHVKEIKFLFIPDNNALVTEQHLEAHLEGSALTGREHLHNMVVSFKEPQGSSPCIVKYQLKITEITPECQSFSRFNTQTKMEELWLIQQGIGDIENSQQNWKYIKQVKPRHGLAAPLSLSIQDQLKFDGNVFCFLPLPVHCKLPVHVNGHFILNQSRNALWPSKDDDRSRWNKNLFDAISSSYAEFLVMAKHYYIRSSNCCLIENDLIGYYNVFPNWSTSTVYPQRPVAEAEWRELAEHVFKKLGHSNASILALVNYKEQRPKEGVHHEGITSECFVEWYPLVSAIPHEQVHFWSMPLDNPCDSKLLHTILTTIGMKITQAPLRIKNHFSKVDVTIPDTKPKTVFCYYIAYHKQAEIVTRTPSHISGTKFRTVENFKHFVTYILQQCPEQPCKEFPQLPFGYPLLLTADEQLREFDEGNKAIISNYSALFSHSLEYFLHPSFVEMKFLSSYFASPEEVSFTKIHHILTSNLPHSLQSPRVSNLSQCVMTTEHLKKLWECLSSDPTFREHIPNILNHWALLLSSDNELFRLSSNVLLPVVPPRPDHEDLGLLQIQQVLKRTRMPFLATNVVPHTLASAYCPELSNDTTQRIKILQNLVFLHQEMDVSTVLTGDNLEIIVDYFKTINFRTDEASRVNITSLPFYLTVDGSCVAIQGKRAYIWPHNGCSIGRCKWTVHYTTVVFLNGSGCWTNLGSPSDLEITNISAEEVYIRYVFPKFASLSAEERFQHLKYIRDHLFDSNQIHMNSKYDDPQKCTAMQFITSLRQTPCIGPDNCLRCASDFCDHRKDIFETFQENIELHFLPECFTKRERSNCSRLGKTEEDECSKWMHFFIAIGTRDKITQSEFITFCTIVADGKHRKPQHASSVLLNFLFSRDAAELDWHSNSFFLSQVSNIAFACTEPLPRLSWILPPCMTHTIRQIHRGQEVINLTPLKETALNGLSSVLWTVKPIITLTFNATWYYSHVVRSLQITTQPTIRDVKRNITTIANTKFSDFKLFDNFPDSCKQPHPETSTSLIDVLIENFEFLSKNSDSMSDEHYTELSKLSCIPVFAKPHTPGIGVVLVQPCYVLISERMDDFHPFLHGLPSELFSVAQFLQNIGVESTLKLSHIRLALERAHKCSKQLELDVNTKKVVKCSIVKLYHILKEVQTQNYKGDIARELEPLYLPTNLGTLQLSSHMLYSESSVRLDLTGTGFAQLYLPVSMYAFNETEFCQRLPESVRPRCISHCCEQKLADDCEVEEAISGISKRLETTFKLKELSNGVIMIVKHQSHNDELCHNFKPVLEQFVQNIHVHQVKNLKITFVLKEQRKEVGSAKVDFHIQKNGATYHLYIDSSIREFMGAMVYDCLIEYIVSIMNSSCTSGSIPSLSNLKTILQLLLRAQTPQDLSYVLNKKGIEKESVEVPFESIETPKLGQPVPETWHHRLDQDISNIFAPEEWVGYEEREGHIIFAQIAYPVIPENKGVYVLQMKYVIFTGEDENGKEVSALDIYKFLRGLKPPREEPPEQAETTREVVPFSGDSDSARVRETVETQKRADIKEVKKKLYNDLRDIWRLPERERDKAIKRLYLKWHPDKNPDQIKFAEEVFKYLKRQIERLEAGQELEDPSAETVPTNPSGGGGFHHSHYWSSYFREWDNTAHSHQRSWRSEHNYNRHYRSQSQHNPFESFMRHGPSRRPEEAKRWVIQAEEDYKALIILFDQVSTCKVSGNVCFMAHQVVEKALKGGMYAVCGLGERSLKSHNLPPLAYALEGERSELRGRLAQLVIPLEPYYLDTRYPNRYPLSMSIPADMYTSEQAQRAKIAACTVLDLMKNIVY